MSYDEHVDCDRQIDKLQTENKRLTTIIDNRAEDREVLEKYRRLQDALANYGGHYSSCATHWNIDDPKWHLCDCGLSQALKEGEQKPSEVPIAKHDPCPVHGFAWCTCLSDVKTGGG